MTEPGGGQRDWRPIPDPTLLTTAQLRQELGTLREIIEARLDAMDTATKLLSETVNRTPTEIQKEIGHLRELAWERFESISLQFAARDAQVEALARTSAESLKAALESADKLAAAHTEAALLANAKTEASFAEQIKALADKIEVNTRQLDKGAGTVTGAQGERSERRLDTGQWVAVAGLLAALVAVAVTIIIATRH